jgi:hypothetical protein
MSDSRISTTTTKAIRIRTNIRAGKGAFNHGLRIRTSVRAGGIKHNHGLRIRTT